MQSLLLWLTWGSQHWTALSLPLLLEFSSYPLHRHLGPWQDYGDGWGNFSKPNFSSPAFKTGQDSGTHILQRGTREGLQTFSAECKMVSSLAFSGHTCSLYTQSPSFYKRTLWKCKNAFCLLEYIKIGRGPNLASMPNSPVETTLLSNRNIMWVRFLIHVLIAT